jgi:HlyD family secretion protein
MEMKYIAITVSASLILLSCNRQDLSDAYGNFEAVEVIVSSESNGQLIRFDLEEGQDIAEGDTLGLVDTTELFLKKQQLVAQKPVLNARARNIDSQVKVQEQQKVNLLVDKARVENLMKDGAATQKQMDDITGALDLLEAQISATRVQKESVAAEMGTLEAQIAQVRESMAKCWIISPLTGTVLVKFAEPGEVTALGKPLCKLANLNALELKVYVSGDQLPYLQLGQDIEVLIDKDKTGFQNLSGKVTWISSKAEFTPKTIQTKKERVNLVYAAKITVPNDGRLKIGMPGEINFMPASE